MMIRRRNIVQLLLVLAGVAGVFGSPARAEEKPLVVFAAASLKNALDDAAAGWVQLGHSKPLISYAASGPLAKQIEAGAPADVFITADLDWMDYAQKKSLIDAKSRYTLLGNKLVLVVPKDSAAAITLAPGAALGALVGEGRLAFGEPRSVPAGKYGQQALEKLGLWDQVKDKLALADSVRSALFLVGRGEAAAGIVYQTDAAAEPNVKIISTFPEDSHPPILYPAAVVAASTNAAGPEFLAFLRTAIARTAFERQGFVFVAGQPLN
jgi:molybdate transport system substrate-binding protein